MAVLLSITLNKTVVDNSTIFSVSSLTCAQDKFIDRFGLEVGLKSVEKLHRAPIVQSVEALIYLMFYLQITYK